MVNTVTSYRSPVRLVKHASEEVTTYSSQAISRARKRLMAEIVLIGDEIIIDDVAYSRNDASTLLDIITENNWKTHSIIYDQKGMLHFLEKEEFNEEELKKADAWLYNSPFVEAVSPYFSHSFNTVSGKLIRQENFEELVKLLNYQGYILPEHSHEAYQKIRTYIDEQNYMLRNLSWEKFIANESILHFIFSTEWKRFINKLPSSFTSLRDELVEQMTHIVLRFQHKATWHYLHQVLVQLKTIETNDFNRSEVERIDKIIYENSRIEGKKGKGRKFAPDGEFSTGRIVWWAIWIILVIVRAATCNNSKDYSFNDNNFQQFQKLQPKQVNANEVRNEPVVLHFMDSLSLQRSLAVNNTPQEIKTGSQPFSSFADDFPRTGNTRVRFTNTTNYNCVALYISGPSREGSVYQGSLPAISAVYIKKGETYSFPYTAGVGKFYFLFGEKWGILKKQTELEVYNGRRSVSEGGRKQILFFYEFFSNKNPVHQKYLQQAIYIDEASATKNEDQFSYLNIPADTGSNVETTILLKENKGQFLIDAKGSLQVKEEKHNLVEVMVGEIEKYKS